ncbi:hypothetical protein BaRGS_00035741 [Batillaria attramentaria]|uniref:Uncharacterized protein n=1 Tax=Batillaria attramentaria TaxID=370345 RepID=A0ABD0JE28_9CAEN
MSRSWDINKGSNGFEQFAPHSGGAARVVADLLAFWSGVFFLRLPPPPSRQVPLLFGLIQVSNLGVGAFGGRDIIPISLGGQLPSVMSRLEREFTRSDAALSFGLGLQSVASFAAFSMLACLCFHTKEREGPEKAMVLLEITLHRFEHRSDDMQKGKQNSQEGIPPSLVFQFTKHKCVLCVLLNCEVHQMSHHYLIGSATRRQRLVPRRFNDNVDSPNFPKLSTKHHSVHARTNGKPDVSGVIGLPEGYGSFIRSQVAVPHFTVA